MSEHAQGADCVFDGVAIVGYDDVDFAAAGAETGSASRPGAGEQAAPGEPVAATVASRTAG